MKLLQLNATANWGSTGKIAEGIGLSALQRGWESYIAYGRSANKSESNLIQVGGKLDVYKHYAIHRFLNMEGLGSRRPTKELISKIKKISPDIIHLHNIHDHWLNYPLLFEYLASVKTPVVWTFHDCWAFTGGCCYFEDPKCHKWKEDCKNCILKRYNSSRSNPNLQNKVSLVSTFKDRFHIVSVSQWLDSLVMDSHLNSITHSYIYNGIDTSLFKPIFNNEIISRLKLMDKKIILGVSNIWDGRKGLNDFIKLSSFLPNDYLIILVGLTKTQILELPTGVMGIERTNDINELAALYTRANVVVSLSKAETFGLTLVEGQACGTPSIGYDATAISEVISPQTGIKVQPGNLQEVADAIKSICGSNQFSPTTIRNEVLKNFDAKSQFNKYIDLYESLLGYR